jgi:hypothetical protein
VEQTVPWATQSLLLKLTPRLKLTWLHQWLGTNTDLNFVLVGRLAPGVQVHRGPAAPGIAR